MTKKQFHFLLNDPDIRCIHHVYTERLVPLHISNSFHFQTFTSIFTACAQSFFFLTKSVFDHLFQSRKLFNFFSFFMLCQSCFMIGVMSKLVVRFQFLHDLKKATLADHSCLIANPHLGKQGWVNKRLARFIIDIQMPFRFWTGLPDKSA